MSWQFVVFLIFAVLAVLVFAFSVLASARGKTNKDARDAAFASRGLGFILVTIGVIFLVFGLFTIVGTRQIGIATSFGKPTGQTFSNGLHWKLPWVSTVEMDAAIQNDVYKNDGDHGDHRIQVRLGNNSTALADVNIRWQIEQDQADELFQQYKTFDNVRSNLVERNLRTALNEAFTKFDPLAGDPVAPVGPDGKPTGAPAPKKVDLNSVTQNALDLIRAKSGGQVDILDLSIPVIDYDDNTEQRINAINAARADTTKAEQEAKTAFQKRLAAEELARQPVPNLQISIAACVNKMAETGTSLNCYPIGSNVLPTMSVPNPAG